MTFYVVHARLAYFFADEDVVEIELASVHEVAADIGAMEEDLVL